MTFPQDPVPNQGLPRAVARLGPALDVEDRHRPAELEHRAQHARLRLELLLELENGALREVVRGRELDVRDAPDATPLRHRRQRRIERFAERATVGRRHALAELEECWRQLRLGVEHGLDRLDLARRQIGRRRRRGHDPAELAAMKVHAHPIADRRRDPRRQRVGELPPQRQVQRDLHVGRCVILRGVCRHGHGIGVGIGHDADIGSTGRHRPLPPLPYQLRGKPVRNQVHAAGRQDATRG